MATVYQNLSSHDLNEIDKVDDVRIGIVVSDWNTPITSNLLDGAITTLHKLGVTKENIIIERVPGSFELTFGAKTLIENIDLDAVIVLGCVIQGETPHFTFVCESVTHGVTQLNLDYETPVIFGLLTTNTMEQAKARSGGRHGNKGDEAAVTAIKMVALNRKYNDDSFLEDMDIDFMDL